MFSQCPPVIVTVIGLFLPLPIPAVLGSCSAISTAFYLAVKFGGGNAFTAAKRNQTAYEREPVCIAKCPTTQSSGGQGITNLVIDLLRSSGSFPVTYQMYTVPDQLYITYEGSRIFDTGGLVSGSRSLNVTFNGTSTIIEATINAPISGTAWDVFIGCPVSP
jgi:hypothetical protein